MGQGTQQTGGDCPKFTIDCLLTNTSMQLQADGCVLASVEDGQTLTSIRKAGKATKRTSMKGGAPCPPRVWL
jgi:hypothetical protein